MTIDATDTEFREAAVTASGENYAVDAQGHPASGDVP